MTRSRFASLTGTICLAIGCSSHGDASQSAAGATGHSARTSTPRTRPAVLACPPVSWTGTKLPISVARADSAARAVLAQADESDSLCVVAIQATDSSLVLDYEDAPLQEPARAPNGATVLRYGGGVTIEVTHDGRARWLYATQ